MNHRACGLTMEGSLRPHAIALHWAKYVLRILSMGTGGRNVSTPLVAVKNDRCGTGPWHTGRFRCISANDRMDSIEHAQRGMKPDQVSEPGVIITR
jgi:hypothetical protein